MSRHKWILALALSAPSASWAAAPPPNPPTIPPVNDPSLSLQARQAGQAGESAENPRQPTLSTTLQSINDDSRALHESDLSTAERTRLALQIRAQGERLPALTVGQPGAVRRSAFEIDRLSGRLLAAVARGDGEAAARESEAIAAAITRLRAELGS